jgi:hypothetical protein
MVHALGEIQRVLAPGGMLIDLRPVADRWPVEVVTAKGNWFAGQVDDLLQLADDAASAEALAQAARQGWFFQEAAQSFDLWYYWDTPEAMQAYLAEEWNGYIELPAVVYERMQALWAQSGSGKQTRMRLRMQLGIWRK